MEVLLKGVQIGIMATIAMDLSALLARYVLRLPTADWALMGRWFGYWFKGVLIHRPIATSRPLANELAFGWIGHYLTGVIYGTAYLAIVNRALGVTPSPGSALIFGFVTLAAPWLFVQPSIGAGVFALRTARPWLIRFTNIAMHGVFGGSLYVGWYLLR